MLPGLSGHLCRELLHQLLLRLCHLHLPRLHGQVAEQGDRGRGGSGQKREFKNFKCNTRRFVQGPGLVFEVYPQAVATLPGSQFWSVIFFFMLIMLGMDSAMGGLECVITGLMDEFRDTFRRRGISREMFTGFVVFFSFIMASTCVTPVNYERMSVIISPSANISGRDLHLQPPRELRGRPLPAHHRLPGGRGGVLGLRPQELFR